ncbi:MAG: CDP-diacylglycerol--glycerol-3-phosphate 3-phosphatidyltransferase [Elusimicrobiota bacterium]|nr:CDP-diacylglycerol--glycerol-3-phosphate 3-phosphatidyltransferase [Endomicrobiia bacterium]MCX7910516.1 CDP-diacylglycerol--glycerol-3-phosphate 3-phosphatidyltransferase [Endomicrobiia bacterium]MDW8165868.1 CDP-diacylglycerol--glycerol-3-phosphate 3-phosphatidyltransferase [Elusimicrobiota bacterium]
MNLATKITIFRILLVPLFLILILTDYILTRILALLVFIFGGITDTLDGIVARKKNMVTKIGSSLDPLADKLLITTAFISFLNFSELKIPVWTVIIIILRDYIITWLRSIDSNYSMPADKTAKIKTFLQNIAIISIILILIFKNYISNLTISWYIIELYPKMIMIFISFFTLASGVIYIIKYRNLIWEQFTKN